MSSPVRIIPAGLFPFIFFGSFELRGRVYETKQMVEWSNSRIIASL